MVVEDEDPKYAGYIIQFGELSDNAEVRQWTGRLDSNSYVQTRFTVLGHLSAGAPDEIRLYKTLDDLNREKPEHVVNFVVDIPNTSVSIGEKKVGRPCS